MNSIYVLAARSHAGVTLVPNLFGKPTVLIVGGGRLNPEMDEVLTAYPYVESSQVFYALMFSRQTVL